MSPARFLLLLLTALCLLAPGLADAEERLRGTYIRIPDEMVVDPIPAGGVNGSVLYLNRCLGGCTITPGSDSSISDTSSIVGGTTTLSPYVHGDESWNQLVSCVRGIFEPFNIEVTDVDPGGASHHEVMVAGTDQEFGFPGALGVSPGTCSPINNSLTFVFANLTPSVPDLCWAAAQEPGHSWTLDHLYVCEDPMTYLSQPCGNSKYAFQNVDAQCHDQEINPVTFCACGSQTENSYQTIMSLFGANPSAQGPAIEIVRPADGGTVGPGFPIEAAVTDISKIDSVDLYINGTFVSSLEFGPFVFNAPVEMTSGTATVEIRSSDVHGFSSTQSVDVTIDPDTGVNGEMIEEGGCGCSTEGGGGSFWLALLGLAYGWRRARRI